ncbi:hypothetical protein CCP3SC15_5040002 [Gammaproteobacteria bacterium]
MVQTMSIIQAIVFILASLFIAFCVWDFARGYVGYNPSVPSAWALFKAGFKKWWKKNVVDDDPYDDDPANGK